MSGRSPQAQVIVFLGTVKWSCGPSTALLSDLTASADNLGEGGGACKEASADGFLVSLGGQLEENWNDPVRDRVHVTVIVTPNGWLENLKGARWEESPCALHQFQTENISLYILEFINVGV